jgi:hypothetical protein
LGLVAAAAHAEGDARIPADSLRDWVRVLADDRLEGRGPGTRGLDIAAEFIAARFAAAGLQPAGDHDGFFQDFEVTIGVRPAGRNALRLAGRDVAFEDEWVAYGFSDTGTTRAALVFAGYGITAPEYSYDDYAGLDAQGKIVLVLRYEPGQEDSTSSFEGTLLTAHADLRRKAILAREHGAVGLLVVTGPASSDPDRLTKLTPDVGYYSTGIACGQMLHAALQAAVPALDLAALQGQIDASGKPASRPLEAAVEWTIGLEKERTRLRNVVGLLPGRDPHRAVVLGAHYDHLGLGGPSSLAPDVREPHNGADDNASGTAALLGLAQHFGRQPQPAHSLVFIAFSGEELGLAGSAHHVKQPLYPPEATTAMLNLDMVGRLRDRRLLVFGTDTAEQFPGLLQAVNGEGPKFDLRMKGDGYGPSDQMSFFKKNVPVLHFFTGPHSEYHRPADDAELLNYEGLSDVAGYVADLAVQVMEQPLTFVGATAPAPSGDGGGGGGFRSYLGTVPDYGQDENLEGVLLSGVRAGSPAERAGLRGGDIIVQIDATAIRNIQDFVFVLRTRKPGDEVQVTVLRDGQRTSYAATLAPRP